MVRHDRRRAVGGRDMTGNALCWLCGGHETILILDVEHGEHEWADTIVIKKEIPCPECHEEKGET